jgi:hypothetical protein
VRARETQLGQVWSLRRHLPCQWSAAGPRMGLADDTGQEMSACGVADVQGRWWELLRCIRVQVELT